VFCEGARTEPEYLDALRREPDVRNAAAVDIRIPDNNPSSGMHLLIASVRPPEEPGRAV